MITITPPPPGVPYRLDLRPMEGQENYEANLAQAVVKKIDRDLRALIDPAMEGQESHIDRLARTVLLVFAMLSEMSLEKKESINLSEKQIMVHAKRQGDFITSEAHWNVVASAIGMVVTGLSIIPQLNGMHIDKFSQAGQQIVERMLAGNYQPKGLIESSSRDVEIQKLQQKNGESQADKATREEAQGVLRGVLQSTESASKSQG